MQSEQQTDTTETPGGESAPAEAVTLRDLLEASLNESPGGESVDATVDNEGEASGDAPKNAKPVKFNDLAGVSDLELDDLYALKVSYADGKELSVEELKDLGAKQDEIVLRELEWEEQRTKQESDLRRAQNELAEIVKALPQGALNEKVLNQVRERQAKHERQQRELTLQNIPSWQDEAVRESELAGMAKHLEAFGLPASFLAGAVDHRMLAFVRSSFLREQRIQAALAKVTAPKPDNSPAPVVTGEAPGATPAPAPRSNARNGLEAFFENL